MRDIIILCLLSFSSSITAQEYKVTIDLTKVNDDKVPVEITFEGMSFDTLEEYHMPKMVPGIYSISDFGRVIETLYAFDGNGEEMETIRLDINRWTIKEAKDLTKITYWVDDTFDGKEFKNIFEPGGTNIEEDNFLINNFGFVGYLKGRGKNNYSMRVIHPEEFYGASPMERKVISPNEEVFSADNYFQLTDSPIMYCLPDTASVKIGETTVMVSVYSPSGKSNAEFMMSKIEPTLVAAGEYLGGKLPVTSYVVMIYLHENHTNSGAMGALEHSYSTVFSYPDVDSRYLAQSIVDVTSHEFFHIVTPLTIHSEEIGNYNFIEAQMSKHLWLYEGVTEYSSMRVQVMYDLIDTDDFFDLILTKMNGASGYNDTLPFTVMSKGALDVYEREYPNVYEKGALIGMCLDLLLLNSSKGDYDIRQLLDDLADEYGVERSFKDEELFDIIAGLSYPETREFFRRYVEGPESLPINDFLAYAGASFLKGEVIKINTLGDISMGFNSERQALMVTDASGMNKFGNDMGFKAGDIIYSLNDEVITMDNYREVFTGFFEMEVNSKVYLEVYRTNKKGNEKMKKLKGRVQQIDEKVGERIKWNEDASENQLKVREAWIGKVE